MKPSEHAKKAGLSSLNELAELTELTTHGLRKICKKNPRRFRILIAGAVIEKQLILDSEVEND